MQHLDEGTIHAWLDGELPSAEREALEAHIAECESCAAAVAEARGFVAASSRILTALDSVPAGVVPAARTPGAPAASRRARFAVPRAWMAVAAVLVLSAVTVIATRSGENAPLARLDESRATRVDAPVPPVAAAPEAQKPAQVAEAPAPPADKSARRSIAPVSPAPQQSQAAGAARLEAADKSTAPAAATRAENNNALAEREKKEEPGAVAGGKPTTVADASPAASPAAAPATITIRGSRAALPSAGALADAKSARDSAGTTLAVAQLASASNEAPRLVSRRTSTENADTVVTTVYAVTNGTVTLIERSPAAPEEGRQKDNPGFSDQLMAKARADARINSITWSDSAGRTRTLRGTVSRDELERIRTALFGATP